MDPDMSQIVYAGPKRDGEMTKNKQSIVEAGKAGLPVVVYNFYNHRAVEGYATVPGRGSAGWTEFKYDRMKNLAPTPAEGTHGYEETRKYLSYSLKQVVPVARRSGGRLVIAPQ